MVRLLQVAAFRAYTRLQPEVHMTQKQFLRDLVGTYMRVEKGKYVNIDPSGQRMVPMDNQGHNPVSAVKQGRCKVCKKNTTQACSACNVNLHTENCFQSYHEMLSLK